MQFTIKIPTSKQDIQSVAKQTTKKVIKTEKKTRKAAANVQPYVGVIILIALVVFVLG